MTERMIWGNNLITDLDPRGLEIASEDVQAQLDRLNARMSRPSARTEEFNRRIDRLLALKEAIEKANG